MVNLRLGERGELKKKKNLAKMSPVKGANANPLLKRKKGKGDWRRGVWGGSNYML